jgi:hypothetical protein
MCKKVLIAALAVVFGLIVIKGTWLGSTLRMKFNNACQAVKDRVPPEQEIQRIKAELVQLQKDDDKYYDQVARQTVSVKKQEREVAILKKNLAERETAIRAMREAVARGGEEIAYNGDKYSKSDLQDQIRRDGQLFLADEALVKSKSEGLKAAQKSLAINQKKLDDLKLVREKMATELQELETALAEERQAEAQEQSTLDDAAYLRLRKDIEATKDKIEFLRTKRTLKHKSDNGPVRSKELKREQESKLDKAIDARFAPKQDVVSDK